MPSEGAARTRTCVRFRIRIEFFLCSGVYPIAMYQMCLKF